MEKAYDLKVLGEKLKARGINVVETELPAVVGDIFDWVEESAVASKTLVDDLLIPVMPLAKKFINKKIEEIKF
jgi:hypothetical protein